jgi:CheY-like chemotaxis protein
MVDDEPRILDGMRRTLHGSYKILTAESGEAGLELQRQAIEAGDPFAVIVSDMRMPNMNGAQFLTAARAADADAVRLILSGQADLESTIAAVNDADLFRFLTKPCEPADLTRALDDALRQYRLVTAERELLERTLRGTVDVLTELLALAAPEAFSRTGRLRTLADAAATVLGCEDDWRLPIVTGLSQIGCIAIPEPVMHAVEAGTALPEAEAAMFGAHPGVAAALLERIPRLDEVAMWIGRQPTKPGPPPAGASPAELAFTAAAAYLRGYEETGSAPRAAGLLQEAGYPTAVAQAVKAAAEALRPAGVIREVAAADVRPGMTLEQDVVTVTGMMLVRKGEQVTDTLALRIHNFAESVGVTEPITVIDGAT